LVILAATIIAFIYGARNIVANATNGRAFDWWWDFNFEFLYWYVWAAFIPMVVWFARRYDPEDTSKPGVLLALFLFGLLIAPLQSTVEWSLALTVEWLRHLPGSDFTHRLQRTRREILLGTFTNIITYSLIVAGYYGYEYYRRYRERQLRSAELEGRLAQAELQNLKMQLQPHFLFNTLHTISVLMMRDAVAANHMLVRLSDLLRLSLDNVGVQEVSLKQELEFLDGYLEIEQTRFQDRLTISRLIEPVTLNAEVPNLILQPLVENAIKHGIAKQPGTGVIQIRSKLINSNLRLEIEDNGPGLVFRYGLAADLKSIPRPRGLGWANTQARLEQLYGAQQKFELENISTGGLVVRVTIPFRTHEQTE
jgi:sensor histidine kinase YesM